MWMTYAAVLFGITVAVIGVVAYFRMTRADKQARIAYLEDHSQGDHCGDPLYSAVDSEADGRNRKQ